MAWGFDLREGKVRMVQMNLHHPSAPANPGSLAERDARGYNVFGYACNVYGKG